MRVYHLHLAYGEHDALALGETFHVESKSTTAKINIMGDKSPKSNQKKSSQKQAVASKASQQKNQAAAAKSAAAKKR